MSRRPKRRADNGIVEVALYDGVRCLGFYRPRRDGIAAFDGRGRRIGSFDTKDNALVAIMGAADALSEGGLPK